MRRKDLEVTNVSEMEGIIKKCKVCRIAMVEDGTPYMVPLNFGYRLEDDTLVLYFHSAKSGKKLDIIKKNSAVCFEMDVEGELISDEIPCKFGYLFESVIGFGNAELIEDVAEKCTALQLLMKQQAGKAFTFTAAQAKSVCIFKIVTTDFSGKVKRGLN